MKIEFYSLTLLLFAITLSAQQNVYVEYIDKQIYRKETTAFLIANSASAVYEERQSKEKASRDIKEGGSDGKAVVLIHDAKPNKFYKVKDSPIIYYNEYIIKEEIPYPVYDSIPAFNWELIPSKTDTIKGYVCNQAKLKFRGTNLTAYYTVDIPIQFGPWKFDGLPGLILKISDDESPNKIYWEATKIIYPHKEKTDFSFNEENYQMSLKEFKILSYKIYDERNKEYIERHGQGAVTTQPKVRKRPYVVEKIYEWEKEGDVWGFYVDYYKKIPPR